MRGRRVWLKCHSCPCWFDTNRLHSFALLKDISQKTREILSILMPFLEVPGDGGKRMLNLEALKQRRFPSATENFLYLLAAAEQMLKIWQLWLALVPRAYCAPETVWCKVAAECPVSHDLSEGIMIWLGGRKKSTETQCKHSWLSLSPVSCQVEQGAATLYQWPKFPGPWHMAFSLCKSPQTWKAFIAPKFPVPQTGSFQESCLKCCLVF